MESKKNPSAPSNKSEIKNKSPDDLPDVRPQKKKMEDEGNEDEDILEAIPLHRKKRSPLIYEDPDSVYEFRMTDDGSISENIRNLEIFNGDEQQANYARHDVEEQLRSSLMTDNHRSTTYVENRGRQLYELNLKVKALSEYIASQRELIHARESVMKTIEELHEKERKKFHHKRKLEDAKKLHSDVREYNYRLSQKELYSENCSDAFKK